MLMPGQRENLEAMLSRCKDGELLEYGPYPVEQANIYFHISTHLASNIDASATFSNMDRRISFPTGGSLIFPALK